MAKPQLAWLQVMPAAAPKNNETRARSTKMPAVGRICSTEAPALMVSMRFAVTNGMAISQATSQSTSSGVAIVGFI